MRINVVEQQATYVHRSTNVYLMLDLSDSLVVAEYTVVIGPSSGGANIRNPYMLRHSRQTQPCPLGEISNGLYCG